MRPVASYKKAGKVLHWAVISPETTLLEWRSDVGGDGNLNLSHICYGGPEEESESPSEEVSESPSEEVSESPSEEVSESPSGSVEEFSEEPSGSVEEVTGTPEEEKTPPQTDAIGAGSTPTSDSWQLVLLALAAVLATALIVTPSGRKARR